MDTGNSGLTSFGSVLSNGLSTVDSSCRRRLLNGGRYNLAASRPSRGKEMHLLTLAISCYLQRACARATIHRPHHSHSPFMVSAPEDPAPSGPLASSQ